MPLTRQQGHRRAHLVFVQNPGAPFVSAEAHASKDGEGYAEATLAEAAVLSLLLVLLERHSQRDKVSKFWRGVVSRLEMEAHPGSRRLIYAYWRCLGHSGLGSGRRLKARAARARWCGQGAASCGPRERRSATAGRTDATSRFGRRQSGQ
jgi:hypothetical protein